MFCRRTPSFGLINVNLKPFLVAVKNEEYNLFSYFLIFGYLLVLIALAGFTYRNKNRPKNPDYIYGRYKF